MARTLPSLNALRAFEAAGRHGRMTLAAQELSVTHSAISRQVQHLEDVLGVPLFEGPKNALRLTEAGRTLLLGLTAAFDQIGIAVRQVADTQDGTLDVSCLGTFTMRWLIPRLHRFRQRHDAIEVRVTAADMPVDFSRAGFDVAVRVGAGPWPADSIAVPLFDEWIGPVLAPGLAARDMRDLSGVPRLNTKTRPAVWQDWQRLSGITSPGENGAEYEHFYFMLEAATAGLGVCIAPWPLVADDLKAGRLLAPFGFVRSGNHYAALRRARRNRKAELFCDWLLEEAGTNVDPPGAGRAPD